MGMYWAMMQHVHDLADRLEANGQLEKLFDQAHEIHRVEPSKYQWFPNETTVFVNGQSLSK